MIKSTFTIEDNKTLNLDALPAKISMLYCRLSSEDANEGESNSISSQLQEKTRDLKLSHFKK